MFLLCFCSFFRPEKTTKNVLNPFFDLYHKLRNYVKNSYQVFILLMQHILNKKYFTIGKSFYSTRSFVMPFKIYNLGDWPNRSRLWSRIRKICPQQLEFSHRKTILKVCVSASEFIRAFAMLTQEVRIKRSGTQRNSHFVILLPEVL